MPVIGRSAHSPQLARWLTHACQLQVCLLAMPCLLIQNLHVGRNLPVVSNPHVDTSLPASPHLPVGSKMPAARECDGERVWDKPRLSN
jgi:hypothetical protein